MSRSCPETRTRLIRHGHPWCPLSVGTRRTRAAVSVSPLARNTSAALLRGLLLRRAPRGRLLRVGLLGVGGGGRVVGRGGALGRRDAVLVAADDVAELGVERGRLALLDHPHQQVGRDREGDD